MSYLQLEDIRLFYELKGEGEGKEVVAFFNGVAMNTDAWIFQTTEFAKRFQVLLHDFRGQGKSTLLPQNITFEQHASDFKELLDYLSIEKVHLVGVSYGAEVGMYFALNYPDRVKTLTIGTAVSESQPLLKAMVESWISAAKTYQGTHFFKVMAPLVYSNSYFTAYKELLNRRAQVFGQIATKEWFDGFIALCENFLSLDITADLKVINSPTLILAGEVDLLKPFFYSQIIQNQISNSKLVVIPDGGHALFVEKVVEFNNTIFEFIESHEKGDVS